MSTKRILAKNMTRSPTGFSIRTTAGFLLTTTQTTALKSSYIPTVTIEVPLVTSRTATTRSTASHSSLRLTIWSNSTHFTRMGLNTSATHSFSALTIGSNSSQTATKPNSTVARINATKKPHDCFCDGPAHLCDCKSKSVTHSPTSSSHRKFSVVSTVTAFFKRIPENETSEFWNGTNSTIVPFVREKLEAVQSTAQTAYWSGLPVLLWIVLGGCSVAFVVIAVVLIAFCLKKLFRKHKRAGSTRSRRYEPQSLPDAQVGQQVAGQHTHRDNIEMAPARND